MTDHVTRKTTGAKSRDTLGDHFANRAVVVEQHGDDAVVVRRARANPEREAWLYENPEPLAAVKRGLNPAREGHVAKSAPDLTATAKLAARLEGWW